MTSRKPIYLRITVSCLFVALPAIAALAWWYVASWNGPREVDSVQDTQRLTAFIRQQPPGRKDFDGLEAYFQDGFAAYKDETGSSASYPGLPSVHGHRTDSIEGFTRIAPLMASYLHSRPDPASRQAIQARQFLLAGWTHGADPRSKGHWGPIADNDQRIVEASDVALSIWLLKDSAWLELPPADRNNIVQWLLQVNRKQTPDNNWHLFVTFVNLVVSSLGYPVDLPEARRHYDRFRTFYRGDGWFSDGPGMRFDYYNAWGIHYQLFWIDQVDSSFDHEFITRAINDFARKLQYLVGPDGFPIMGRSICYRMAITSPLILAQKLSQHAQPSVRPGAARRALDATWRYFIANGGVDSGRITQGYCGFDPRVLDSYSGPASCQWGLRSLVSALYIAPSDAFWTTPEEPLPVELADYSLSFPQPGWTVVGHKPNRIVIQATSSRGPIPLAAENPLLILYDRATGKVHRPDNEAAKYGLREYRSDIPFCNCAPAH